MLQQYPAIGSPAPLRLRFKCIILMRLSPSSTLPCADLTRFRGLQRARNAGQRSVSISIYLLHQRTYLTRTSGPVAASLLCSSALCVCPEEWTLEVPMLTEVCSGVKTYRHPLFLCPLAPTLQRRREPPFPCLAPLPSWNEVRPFGRRQVFNPMNTREPTTLAGCILVSRQSRGRDAFADGTPAPAYSESVSILSTTSR